MLSNDEILLKHRIRQLLKFKKMTISDIAETETLRARYGRQINGDASVPFTTIHLLLRTFPDDPLALAYFSRHLCRLAGYGRW